MMRRVILGSLVAATLGLTAALAGAPAPTVDRGISAGRPAAAQQVAWRRWYYRPYARPFVYGPRIYRPYVARPVFLPPPPMMYGPPGFGVYVW